MYVRRSFIIIIINYLFMESQPVCLPGNSNVFEFVFLYT